MLLVKIRPVLALCSSVATVVAPLRAAAHQPTWDAPVEEGAATHFRRGSELFMAERWVEAKAEFRAAWQLRRAYDVAANLGHTEFRLGEYRDAAEHLSFAIRSWPPDGNPRSLDLLRRRIEEARLHVAVLTLRVAPPAAAVSIDGRSVEESPTPAEIFLDPGPHTLEARARRHLAKSVSIVATAGSSLEVRVALQHEGGPDPVLLVGGAILGTGAAATGVALALLANGEATSAEEQTDRLAGARGPQPCRGAPASDVRCRAIQQSLDARDRLGVGAAVAFVGAGAVGVTTLVYGLLAPKRAAAPGLRVLPAMSAEHWGGMVFGAW